MSKTFVYDRFDVGADSVSNVRPEMYEVRCSDGDWVRAEDAINREAVLQAKIRTLETQLKDLKEEMTRGRLLLTAAGHALRSYQFGNSATDLAKDLADKIESIGV